MAQRPGFFFCLCPDGTLLRRHVEQLLADNAEAAWEKHVFWGDEELPPRFWELLTLQGLFATPRAIVVRNADRLASDIWKRLSGVLAHPASRIFPILCLECPWEKGQPKLPPAISRQPCFQFADNRGWVWRSPGLDPRSLRRYVQTVAREKGLQLAQGTLEKLCQQLPPDAAAIDTELSKLSMLASGEPLAPEAVELESSVSFNIFTFLTELQSGRTADAWKKVLEEQRNGEEPLFYILTMLQREARQLWQIRMGEPVRMAPGSLAVKKQSAAKLGMSGLVRLWDILHTAELSVKTGRRTPSQALDALMGELVLLFSASATVRMPR